MASKMAFHRLHTNSNSRAPHSSNSSTSSRNDDAAPGVPEPSPRRTLRKNPPSDVTGAQSSNPRGTADTRASAMRRRLSTRERSATLGSRPSTLRVVPPTPRETPHASNASLADMSSSASESKSTANLGSFLDSDQDDKHVHTEGNEFLDPINFDDFHNSIMSKEPSLSHFPLPAQSTGGNEGQVKKTVRSGPTLSQVRDAANVSRSDSNSSGVKSDRETMGPPPAPGRRRRQSFVPAPSSGLSGRQPRKSIGPGMLVTDTTEHAVRRRPSLVRKHLSDENRHNPVIQRLGHAQDHAFLSTPRTHKTRSLQPPPRTGDGLAPGSTAARASSNTDVRTPVKNRLGGAVTPSSGSSKRMSMMPVHATGLGARTISPTDARRMKRMSLIPQPPPIPRASPTQQEITFTARPRSAVPSPSMIPRKSVTPSSNRTTPDPNRKSYTAGLSVPSNTTPSVRNSNNSLQVRLSQNLSTSRLPTAKPRHENTSNEEDVPPVPAIPKDFKARNAEQNPIILRKSSLPIDLINQRRSSKDEHDERGEPGSQSGVAHGVGENIHNFEIRHKPAISLSKKNLQPLKLPPLNLLPLGDPMETKIESLKERKSRNPIPGPPQSPTLPLLPPKTPTTPLTASKANFFSHPVNEHITRPMTQTRSNSSHFTPRTFSTVFHTENNSSSLDNEPTDYINARTPKAPEWNYIPTTPCVETPKAPVSKPAGPRPQTQVSAFSPMPETSKLRHVSYNAVPNNGPPSPRRVVEHKKSVSRILPPIDTNSDRSKYESMPPPKLPASATWHNLANHTRMSPTPNASQAPTRRRPSVSIPASAAIRRNQSISSEQNTTSSPSDSGDVESHPPRTASIFSPTHRNVTSRPTSSPKPRTPDITTFDKDDLIAEEQMRKLGSSRRDFEAAAKELAELRRRASPKERATPAQALKVANLNIFEKGEIIDFKDIYFCGTHRAKKHVGDLNASTANFGYDDERGDYNIVIGDHIAYRYEIVDVLGKGSFGQVVRCVDHKTGKLVAVKIIRNKKRFHQQALVEVNILKKLKEWDPERKHSVVNFTQSFYFRGHLCISTELLGMNLYELIKAYDFRGFSTKVIRRFTKQILSTLVLLEAKKVVHCDLKPENILMVHPMRAEIKVIDFGSSCFENEKVYTYIQSRFYRSPEVILGMSYGMPIDMWSLGCILAELYTGYPIFPGENEQEQLACIMEIFGPPEKHLIEKSTRKKLFFDSQGKPRLTVSSKGRRRKPSSKDLRSVLKCDDDAFVDFIARCLRWDPARRLKPHDALKHEFITGQKMAPRTRSYLTSSPGPKRLISATTASTRPLPDPPSGKRIGTSPIKHKPVSSNPIINSGVRRTTTNGLTTSASVSNLNSQLHSHPSNTGTSTAGSALPRAAGRKTSARPDLAAAAAATSLVSQPSPRRKRGVSKPAPAGAD